MTGANGILSGQIFNDAYATVNSLAGREDSAANPISIGGDFSAFIEAIKEVADNTSRIPGESTSDGGRK